MPLEMNREVFITCAVTGSGGTQDRSPHVPRSPKQIADSMGTHANLPSSQLDLPGRCCCSWGHKLVIMHPGPINRGVEITSEVADSEQSVILDQVENGVAVRMAVLYLLAGIN